MFIKKLAATAMVLFSALAFAQTTKEDMAQLIKDNFWFAEQQYKYLMQKLPADKMPQSYNAQKDQVITYQRTWWCTGFYPGTLWLIYEQTRDPKIKEEAERTLKVIEPNQYYTGNHDVGFMIFDSFGQAYRITKNPEYKDVIFNAAKSLATRYKPAMKAIQSWNKSKRWESPVIIDNMMNLELLLWVSQHGGDKKLAEIAINHANTTMKNHFRDDYSSYHVVDYDVKTGKVLKKKTWQGYSDASAWSRGQAWGLYGYTMMYRFTKERKYLRLAEKIAKFILDNPNLPKDKVPYWDFDAPGIPNTPRDASAAAIMASAFLELDLYTQGKKKETYVDTAEQILKSLSSPAYRAELGGNGGFLLKHSTGAFPLNSEVDVPLIYADYYFLEALKRYKDWYLN